jgi:uncharacterized membrane protein
MNAGGSFSADPVRKAGAARQPSLLALMSLTDWPRFVPEALGLLIVAAYAVLNALLTMAFLAAGQAFYGYSSMIAAATTFVVAFLVLLRELPWLHYHAFITNNSSL